MSRFGFRLPVWGSRFAEASWAVKLLYGLMPDVTAHRFGRGARCFSRMRCLRKQGTVGERFRVSAWSAALKSSGFCG